MEKDKEKERIEAVKEDYKELMRRERERQLRKEGYYKREWEKQRRDKIDKDKAQTSSIRYKQGLRLVRYKI